MFEARVFLAGPSRFEPQESEGVWDIWHPQDFVLGRALQGARHVYIADAGLESFLHWFDHLPQQISDNVHDIVWCGDGDSLGKHGGEILAQTAARFEGRWRQHVYSSEKDFSDCAALISLINYDLRHAAGTAERAWFCVHGAWGGRADHELINLFELSLMVSRLPCPASVVVGPHRVITTAPVILNLPPDRKFSVLSAFANHEVRVRVSGARYSGDIFLKQPSHGLSNITTAEHTVLEPSSPGVPILAIISGGFEK